MPRKQTKKVSPDLEALSSQVIIDLDRLGDYLISHLKESENNGFTVTHFVYLKKYINETIFQLLKEYAK